jgi:hypothetical protein
MTITGEQFVGYSAEGICSGMRGYFLLKGKAYGQIEGIFHPYIGYTEAAACYPAENRQIGRLLPLLYDAGGCGL